MVNIVSNLFNRFKIKPRQSNIELLRILSILLIISFHYVYKSGYIVTELNTNTLIVKTFYLFGELGVNLFILITGYFMVKEKFKVKKLILLIAEVIFYYLIIILIGIKCGVIFVPNNIKDWYTIIFGNMHASYWFIIVYIIIYILSPYFNILINNMSKKEFKRLLIISLIIWSIIPTFLGVFYNTSETLFYYSRLIWLIIIYFVGAYIRLYDFEILDNKIKKLLCACLSFLIMFFTIIFIYNNLDFFSKLGLVEISYFWTPNNIFMFLLSISIFGLFLSVNIKELKIVNILSTTTLGIYLLHDNIINSYMWYELFNTKQNLEGLYPLEHIILGTIIIFIVGASVDIIRQFIEKHTLDKLLDCVLDKKR